MPHATCSQLDCDRSEETRRGLCAMHYHRLRRYGDPSIVKGTPPPPHHPFHIWQYVVITNTCWLWTGPLNSKGYGRASSRMAHRVVFELLGGVLPEGHELDHLCRVRNCVRLDHLQPVSRSENMRRSWAARKAVAA